MKLNEINPVFEMAHKGGNLTKVADEYAARLPKHFEDAEVIGEIEEYTIKQKSKLIGMFLKSELVASISLDTVPNAYSKIDDLWVNSAFRNKKLLAKLLWFIHSRLNVKKMLLGKVHSDDTVAILKAGGLSKFKKYWFDSVSGEKEEFSPDTVDDFYRPDKRSWSVMLENSDGDFLNMPKFNTIEAGYISQSYDWQIK